MSEESNPYEVTQSADRWPRPGWREAGWAVFGIVSTVVMLGIIVAIIASASLWRNECILENAPGPIPPEIEEAIKSK